MPGTWVARVERWGAASMLTRKACRFTRNTMLSIGRWLLTEHPQVAELSDSAAIPPLDRELVVSGGAGGWPRRRANGPRSCVLVVVMAGSGSPCRVR